HAFAPLISVPWNYPAKIIRLHALRVTGWRGEPQAREGHPLRWSRLEEIDSDTMPSADRPILAALRLPPFYAITPPNADPITLSAKWGQSHFSQRIGEAKKTIPQNDSDPISLGDSTLLQLRLAGIDRNTLRSIVQRLLTDVPALHRRLLINSDIELARELGIGAHLRATQLLELHDRPLPRDVLIGASCHEADELDHAAKIGVDFATLSPIHATASHPDARSLGWEVFAQLVADARLPVFALGGVGRNDLACARAAGAQGVAGISGFFPAS
ncbi:MAG: thiamine phosphate synthase, partial [Pseudomonadota bacterium]|nr:thiamine phosphate synthase [Pseudomonadota bacterium]